MQRLGIVLDNHHTSHVARIYLDTEREYGTAFGDSTYRPFQP